MNKEKRQVNLGSARTRLLDAALRLIRKHGYAATTVDMLCNQAGVTKGAFFHHFRSKEDLAVAAADYWSKTTGSLFESAPYHEPKDPLARLLAYVDFRRELISGNIPEFTCLVGTMVQEVYEASPEIRDACQRSIAGHAATLEKDFADAAANYDVELPSSARDLAMHTQAVIQGAFVLAKAGNDPAIVRDSLDHLSNYIRLIFNQPISETKS